MTVRLATIEDFDRVAELGRQYMAEAKLPGFRFDEAAARESFDAYLNTANPTVFVYERRGKIIGMLIASIQPYLFMAGLWTMAEILFVPQENRGTRAAAELLAHFDAWSERLGATMSTGGNSNRLYTDRTASLYARFGFEDAGKSMVKFRSG